MPTAERALLHRGGRRGTWGSLGLWHDQADDYAEACEALARAVGAAAGIEPGERVLSIGCGAGDELLLWALGFGAAEVWGVEHDPLLVAAAQHLVQRTPLPQGTTVHVLAGDAAQPSLLALPRRHFDRIVCVDAAYHLSPRAPFLRRMAGLLRPGGRFFCLEFSHVTLPGLDKIYDLYSFKLLPELGALIAKDRDSYKYLVESIRRFPPPEELAARMGGVGFERVEVRTLSGGIAAIHSGWKL
jgi:demethylmenaquinone methyltransferase/2-methoxy-6-polyprenyl-1,4-benzoquinol methylase